MRGRLPRNEGDTLSMWVTWYVCMIRYQFFTRNQSEGEGIDSFITELRNRAKDCEFGTLTESLVKDRLICGLRDDNVRRRLLRVDTLTLEQAINNVRAGQMKLPQFS